MHCQATHMKQIAKIVMLIVDLTQLVCFDCILIWNHEIRHCAIQVIWITEKFMFITLKGFKPTQTFYKSFDHPTRAQNLDYIQLLTTVRGKKFKCFWYVKMKLIQIQNKPSKYNNRMYSRPFMYNKVFLKIICLSFW